MDPQIQIIHHQLFNTPSLHWFFHWMEEGADEYYIELSAERILDHLHTAGIAPDWKIIHMAADFAYVKFSWSEPDGKPMSELEGLKTALKRYLKKHADIVVLMAKEYDNEKIQPLTKTHAA